VPGEGHGFEPGLQISDVLYRAYAPYAPGPAHHLSSPRIEWRTAFRNPPHFTVMAVMSVISGTFSYTLWGFTVTVLNRRNRHRHFIVTVTVIEEMA
jgi:hypothetical protein